MLPTQVMTEFGCSFVHKRIGAAVRGGLTGGFGGAIGGFLGGATPAVPAGPPTIEFGPRGPVGPVQPLGIPTCPSGFERVGDECHRSGFIGDLQRFLPFGETGTAEPIAAGELQAVMGRFGPALVPAARETITRVCLPGMVVAKDGLCYNRRDVTNKERLYPRGTRPLLTGGEMKILRKARSLDAKLHRLGLVPPKKKKAKAKRLHS